MSQWNGSQVMPAFAKIAAEQGLLTSDFSRSDGRAHVGNPDKPVEVIPRNEATKEYGVTKETGEELINKAHPGNAVMALSMGDGGLVENKVQQQKKDIEIATSMPSAALVGKHAAVVQALVRLANNLDETGKAVAADRVDAAVRRLGALPFDGGLRKEAVGLLALVALIGGGLALSRAFGGKLMSLQEGLATDINDILEVSKSAAEGNPGLSTLHEELVSTLGPYVTQFRRPIPAPGDTEGLTGYVSSLTGLQNALPKAQGLVDRLTATPEPWYKLGLGAKDRLKGKMGTLAEELAEVMKTLGAAAKVGQGATVGPEDNISAVQRMLAEQGLAVKATGTLDESTKNALRRMERQLGEVLKPILERKGWQAEGLLLKPDGTVIGAESMRKILELSKEVAKRK